VMKKGELYICQAWSVHNDELTAKWLMKTCLYLEEDVSEREDGYMVINHAFLLNGKREIVSQEFLKFMKKAE